MGKVPECKSRSDIGVGDIRYFDDEFTIRSQRLMTSFKQGDNQMPRHMLKHM